MLHLMHMCVWNSMRVWISYRSCWQKCNFISIDKIPRKHYPKWNAYTCPSKYWVVLKCTRNETSCEQNLFSRQFEITNQYEFITPLMWTFLRAKSTFPWDPKWTQIGLRSQTALKSRSVDMPISLPQRANDSF